MSDEAIASPLSSPRLSGSKSWGFEPENKPQLQKGRKSETCIGVNRALTADLAIGGFRVSQMCEPAADVLILDVIDLGDGMLTPSRCASAEGSAMRFQRFGTMVAPSWPWRWAGMSAVRAHL